MDGRFRNEHNGERCGTELDVSHIISLVKEDVAGLHPSASEQIIGQELTKVAPGESGIALQSDDVERLGLRPTEEVLRELAAAGIPAAGHHIDRWGTEAELLTFARRASLDRTAGG